MSRYYVKTIQGVYLVSGTINGVSFDGQGKPYIFNEQEVEYMRQINDFIIEEIK